MEDTAAQIVEVPAGLAEEVFEIGELPGLDDTGEGTAAGTENPSASQGPEGPTVEAVLE